MRGHRMSNGNGKAFFLISKKNIDSHIEENQQTSSSVKT